MHFLGVDPWERKKKKRPEVPPPPSPSAKPPARITWKVVVTEDARRSIDALPANVREGVESLIERLSSWPEVTGIRPLWGTEAKGKFRMKFWDWRLEFGVDRGMGMITVERIGHRSEFYEPYHP